MAPAEDKPDDRTMTETPQDERTATEPDGSARPDRVDTANLRDYSQLRRSLTDRKVAGVAGGLGRHLNIDPTVLRVLFVVLCFFGGAGFVAYGAAWLLVPEEGQEQGKVRTRPGTRNVLLLVAAGFAALLLLGDSWGDFGPPWPLAVIAVVVLLVVLNRDQSTSGPGSYPGAPAAPGMPTSGVPTSPPPSPSRAPETDRGPRLFWLTLALVAVALGLLGLYETAGGTVVDTAYAALALAVIGAMLVIGAWFGRPGGLILLGVVAAVALAATSAATDGLGDGPRRIDVAPTNAGLVRDSYYLPAGDMRVDLSEVQDLESLDGRRIALEANAGEIEVIVPEGVDVEVVANVDVAGEASVVGYEENGPNVFVEREIDGGSGAPQLALDLRLLLGSIEVSRAS